MRCFHVKCLEKLLGDDHPIKYYMYEELPNELVNTGEPGSGTSSVMAHSPPDLGLFGLL